MGMRSSCICGTLVSVCAMKGIPIEPLAQWGKELACYLTPRLSLENWDMYPWWCMSREGPASRQNTLYTLLYHRHHHHHYRVHWGQPYAPRHSGQLCPRLWNEMVMYSIPTVPRTPTSHLQIALPSAIGSSSPERRFRTGSSDSPQSPPRYNVSYRTAIHL